MNVPEFLPEERLVRWPVILGRIGWIDRIGLLGVFAITVVALFAPWLAPFNPQLRVAVAYLPPSTEHWFGTDEIGRDLFSRIVLGVQYTWLPAIALVLFSLIIGTCVGMIPGLISRRFDMLAQWLVDFFLVLPSTLVALAVIATLGAGLANTMIAIGIAWWPWYARISRDELRRLNARPHAEAARVAGVSGPRLLLRYILPGAIPALLVAATLDVANVIMTMSLMSFIGLGQPAPAPELGAMTSRALDSLSAYWWLPILPAAVIFLICLLANLAGDGLRAALRGS
ncbi:peptide/nickel transport system permease protein [Rhizobium sp. BK529]|uniref:ABC transporter permease n=1 Tax=unclassified Rhizobium TaxID=2613769 RepID=UPI001043D570|nr:MULTISPECIES: ABC transporter permease [unclassified Rhizobium]MBB3594249.1 peptide/nickel transport system permease protein [Rhizobium sp. BK529]TCS01705.1 peptide/nickel transport system permease protein [Rhizobium sp. BK418]